MPVDKNAFRTALGRFASGVTVVTTCDATRRPMGLTVSAFSSLSLEPPLILICVDKRPELHNAVRESGVFAVNILAADQELISRRFATRDGDKFAGLAYRKGLEDVPVLEESLTVLECRLKHIYEGGDHTIFVGEVEAAAVREAAPLIYYKGGYARLTI